MFTEGSFSGNTDLSEETATTWTAGIVLRPEFAPGLSLSLDWYDIEIEDAINTPEAIELAELCVDQPSLDNQFCDGITRDAETGFITGFSVQPDNVASFRTAGLDVALDYRIAPTTAVISSCSSSAGTSTGWSSSQRPAPTWIRISKRSTSRSTRRPST